MVYIRYTFSTSEGLEIISLNKDKIFKYQMKFTNRTDNSIVFNINFTNEHKEIVLSWKLKLTNEWLNKIDLRNTEGKTFRETLDLRIESMVRLIETENCSFDLPISEEEFFTKLLYN